MKIYADFNGSTPIYTDVQNYLMEKIQNGPFANPNASHGMAKDVLFGFEKARRAISSALGCKTGEIIFNSGASEGISQIFYSLCHSGVKDKKNIILSSGIEHSAVVNCCKLYKHKGFETIFIKTKSNGVIDLEDFQKLISKHKDQIAFVTVMAANNETGVIQPYQEIGKTCHDFNLKYFSDTTQLIGKTDFNFAESNMDFAVLSSHKIGSLIGSGLIIAKDKSQLEALVQGGGQESCLRGGTQNYIGIEAMAVALKVFQTRKEQLTNVKDLKEKLENRIKAQFPKIVIIGENAPRLATTTLIAYPGLMGQAVQANLESKEVYVTTSSACCDDQSGSSGVLKAMDVPAEVGQSVVRISLCMNANEELYENIYQALSSAYLELTKK